MRTTTLKFVVFGDSYDELVQAADLAISKFLGSNVEPDDDEEEEYETAPPHNINYELVVSETQDLTSEYEYSAEVIARIKDAK
jgi:hypothetical protein